MRRRRGEGLDEAQLAWIEGGAALISGGAGASKAKQTRFEVSAVRLVEAAHEPFGEPA
ncbi:MAG: hypothetical protein R3C15_21080 [Thermoleophilia bacterium]